MKTRISVITTITAICFAFFLQSCVKDCKDPGPSNVGVPACIKAMIEQLKQEHVRTPAASVTQYTYHGQTVYYIPATYADMPSELYDSNCNLICHPDGGMIGNGDGRCTDFFEARHNEKLIWQDDRTQ